MKIKDRIALLTNQPIV